MPTPWTTRVWQEFRAGNLTRSFRDVLLTLRTFRGAGGACWPSHATLADRARCSGKTAQRALKLGRRLGLVSWTERRVRAGWRWLRTSNAYRLMTPDGAVRPSQRPTQPAARTTGHSDRRGEREVKKKALGEMLQAASKLPDLLAARRQTIKGRLLKTNGLS
jgi:hypothetical protein